jgi:hypothetical protein
MMNRIVLRQIAEIALVLLVLVFAGAEYGAFYSAAGRAFTAFDASPASATALPAALGHP